MKNALSIKMLFAVLCFINMHTVITHSAYANATTSIKTYENIQSEIAFRAWDTKGAGKIVGKETLTVIKSTGGKGDIVILRWMENSNEFKAEIYRSDTTENAAENTPATWSLVSDSEQKTLSHQYGDYYVIHQFIDGKDGGQKRQSFNLVE